MKKKIALVTGVTGQDGSYLSEFLLKKNYKVFGLKRRSSSYNTSRVDHILEENKNFKLIFGDLSDASNLNSVISEIMPDEIYNLGAQSHVAVSFKMPEYTAEVNGIGALRILEIIKNLKKIKDIKLYQASTSELFGNTSKFPQNENTPFYPRSPYACAKLFAYWITINYREAYNIFASNGILFNHESPRRGETFITRKITIGLSKIFYGLEKCLYVGNIYAKRDWGDAEEYAAMQWRILQQSKPSDYVIATGKQYTVKKFIELSCLYLGFKIGWRGKGMKEIGFVKEIFSKQRQTKFQKGQVIIRIDPVHFRPTEVDNLIGDISKSQKELKWKSKLTIDDLVKKMIDHDLKNTKI
jgi:GDPmannose 4,6-dehydratase